MFKIKERLASPKFSFFGDSSNAKAPTPVESSPTIADKESEALEFYATHFSIKEEVQNATRTTTLDVSKSEFYVDGIRNHLIKIEGVSGENETLIANDWITTVAGEEEEIKKELFFARFSGVPEEIQKVIYRCHQRLGFSQLLILPIQEMFEGAERCFIRSNKPNLALNRKEITYHAGSEKIIYVERQGISHYHNGDQELISISEAYIETTQVFNRHGEYAEPPKVILSLPAHILDQLKKTCAEKIKQHKALSGLEQSFYDAIISQQQTSMAAPTPTPTPKTSMFSSWMRKAPTWGLFSSKHHPSSTSQPDMSSCSELYREEMSAISTSTPPSPEPKLMPDYGMY